MNNYTKLLVAGTSLCMCYTAPVFAQDQDEQATALEEIVITGRKREESLQDVPISISVLGQSLIEDAGLVEQKDLFDLVPGIHYDEAIDRNSALPSVRGVQSNEIATNKTKVTAFIDGMPILGSQGSIGLGSAAQVEVYRGPQSAAFGRSTFGGAINYVSRDPGDELEGGINVDVNDFGRRIVSASVSGPINDMVGFLVNVEKEETDAFDDYIATDGTEYGTRSGESIGAKLVFTPSDNLTLEFAYSDVSTADGPSASYFLSQEARDACFDGTVTTGMGGGVYASGVFDCDWSQGVAIAAQNDRTVNLIAAGETNEDILFLAESQSLPASEVGSFDDRERFQVQVDYLLDNGSALQFSGFKGEEYYIRGNDGSLSADGVISITEDPMNPGLYSVNTDMGAEIGTIMSDPTDIEETYAEIRWVSPAENRLRYVVGASYYDYSFVTNLYFGGYGAILQGQEAIDRYDALVGNTAETSVGLPTQVFQEDATNTGVFFNLTYDVTDKLSTTLEARYQVDDVSGADTISGASGDVSTKAILPRISFNYAFDDNTSFYGQISRGNNPAGVNVGFFNPDNQNTLNNGIADGLGQQADGSTLGGACDGSDAAQADTSCNSFYVSYDSDTFATYSEETLTNYELGIKGALLDGRLTYATAVYVMDWKDQVQVVNLNWDNPLNVGPLANDFTTNRSAINQGDLSMKGAEFEGNLRINDNWSLRGTFSVLDADYINFCDVGSAGNGVAAAAGVPQITADDGIYEFDCDYVAGLDVAGQPPLSGSLAPTFNTELGNGIRLSARGDVRYESAEYLDSSNLAETKGVAIFNASVALRTDNWSATLYVNNLTDDDTPLRYSAGTDYSLPADDALAQSNYFITPRAPRTIGLRASYNF